MDEYETINWNNRISHQEAYYQPKVEGHKIGEDFQKVLLICLVLVVSIVLIVGAFLSLLHIFYSNYSHITSQNAPWPVRLAYFTYCIVPCGLFNICGFIFCKKYNTEDSLTIPSEWNRRLSADQTFINFNSDSQHFQSEPKDLPPSYEEVMGLE